LCIKFGLTELTNKNTTHIFGNTNKDNIYYNDKFWRANGGFKKYLSENIRSGNSGGYSDITFLNKGEDDYEDLYFVSVKYYEKEKKIDNYDVSKLCVLQEKHTNPKRRVHIYLFVKDKEKAISNFMRQNTSSNVLIKFINPGGKYENIYDMRDLHKYYFQLRELLDQYNYFNTDDDINNFEKKYLTILKPPFIARFHQKLFIEKISDLTINKNEKAVLVGAIPRSGKSYIMAGSILDYVRRVFKGKYFNFVMITPAPNETFGEYTDIFENYIDFANNDIDYKVFSSNIKSSD